VSRIRPVYVDGPLEGQRFDTDSYSVQAVEYDVQAVEYDVQTTGSPFAETRTVTYQFQQFGFHMGGKAVVVWLGYCHGEPNAETVAKALLRPEIFERSEVRDMPKDLTR
jgi:hypothetical protein